MKTRMKALQTAIIIILVGVFFYIAYLLSKTSLNVDEAQTLWIISRPLPDIFRLSITMSIGPLYYIIAHFWVTLWGSSLLALRGLSLVFYISTLFALYSLVRDMSDRRLAIVTAGLFALSPFIVLYGFVGSRYLLIALIVTLNHQAFLRFIRSYGEKSFWIYVITAIAGFYTHYLFALLFISQLIYMLYYYLRQVPAEKRDHTDYISAYLLIFALAAPLGFFVFQLGGIPKPAIPPPENANIMQLLFNFLIGYQSSAPETFLVSFWPLLGMLMFFTFAHGKKLSLDHLDYFLTVTVLPLIIVFAVSSITSLISPQDLIFLAPGIFLLLSLSLLRGTDSFSTALVPVVIAIMFLFLVLQTTSAFNPAKEDYSSLSSYLNQSVTPSDVVVASPPFTAYPLLYYYLGPAKLDTLPQWNYLAGGTVPSFDQKKFLSTISSYQSTYERIFLVTSYNSGYISTVRDYLDHHYARVDTKTFSPDLTVIVYKLRYDLPVPITL